MSKLFSATTLAGLPLRNRVVMAPMTRSRSIDNVPGDIVATYYRQRAGAGLIITEGVAPHPDGLGYPRIPGAFSDAQIAGWRAVTDAVHDADGRIFVQFMHTGRVGHPLNLPEGAHVRGPSALAAPGEMYTDQEGPKAHPVPEPMTEADIDEALEAYASSGRRAVEEAGFDGVELHGANGYLIDQFLNAETNRRTDRWGGSIENRARFAVEAARRTAAAVGADKVGIRLSPYGVFNGTAADEDTDALYAFLAKELGDLGLAYVHIVDHSAMGAPEVPEAIKASIREGFGGDIILSGGYDRDRAEADLAAGKGALVAFGRPFISNPDLVEKLEAGAELVEPDPATFYTPGPEGYIDY